MEISTYMAADEAKVIALWNRCLPEDVVDRDNFYKRVICDVNFDPRLFLIAWDGCEPVGFIYGTMRQVPDEAAGLQVGTAWLVMMGVAPEYRRHGLGRQLYYELEARLSEKCKAANHDLLKIELGAYSSNYFIPGADFTNYPGCVEFFKAMGYSEKGNCVSMDINLHGYRTPPKYLERKADLERAGYVFKTMELQDCLPTFDFLRRDFPYWLPVVRENVLHRIETIEIVYNPQGEVKGYAMSAMDGTPERFGPFGVSPSEQGTGLGGLLFHNLVSNMIKRRIFYTRFMWTGGRNIDIYSTWGMKVFRTYTTMEKILKG